MIIIIILNILLVVKTHYSKLENKRKNEQNIMNYMQTNKLSDENINKKMKTVQEANA